MSVNATPYNNDGSLNTESISNAIFEIQTYTYDSAYQAPPEPESDTTETFVNYEYNSDINYDMKMYPINIIPIGYNTKYYGKLGLFNKKYLPWYGSSSKAIKYAEIYKHLGYLSIDNILLYNNTIDPLINL